MREQAATDLRYEYHFRGVVEAYDVLAEGLEQTFVIARKGTGPLRIEGSFGGNLAPAAIGSGIELRDASGRSMRADSSSRSRACSTAND